MYNPYEGVTDIYPVDSNGRPLEGITLFDQNGNPIVIGDRWRCAVNGTPPPETPSYPMCVQTRHESSSPSAPSALPSPSVSPSS